MAERVSVVGKLVEPGTTVFEGDRFSQGAAAAELSIHSHDCSLVGCIERYGRS